MELKQNVIAMQVEQIHKLLSQDAVSKDPLTLPHLPGQLHGTPPGGVPGPRGEPAPLRFASADGILPADELEQRRPGNDLLLEQIAVLRRELERLESMVACGGAREAPEPGEEPAGSADSDGAEDGDERAEGEMEDQLQEGEEHQELEEAMAEEAMAAEAAAAAAGRRINSKDGGREGGAGGQFSRRAQTQVQAQAAAEELPSLEGVEERESTSVGDRGPTGESTPSTPLGTGLASGPDGDRGMQSAS